MSQNESPEQKEAREAAEAKKAEEQAAAEKAAADKKAADEAKKKPTSRYFKSLIAGLSFQVSESDPANPVAPENVRFVPYREKYQGDPRNVGYLECSDPALLERLDADHNVEEISAKEFKEATGKDAVRASY